MSIEFPEKNDLQRLMYLYSEISEEDISNNLIPSDILDFWKTNLTLYSLQTQNINFTLEEIQQAFTAQGIIPMSIVNIANILVKDSIITEEVKINSQTSTTANDSLLVSLVSSLWSYGSSLIQSNEDAEKQKMSKVYVNTAIFNEIQRCLIKYINENKQTERNLNGFVVIQDLPNFHHSLPTLVSNAIEHCHASDLTWKLFIQRFHQHDLLTNYLVQQGLWERVDDKILQIKQFSTSYTSSSSTKASATPKKSVQVEVINDERALAKLRIQLTLHQVTTNIDNLQQKINLYFKQALAAKKLGNESQALLKLKLKKNSTETQKRLFQAQYNLEEALQSLESTHLNSTIINAYQIATHGLKKSREESNISVESVDDVMEEFQNEMDELKSINEVFDQYQSTQFSSEDEEALAKELEELMQQCEPVNGGGEQIISSQIKLPPVPSHGLSSAHASDAPLPPKDDRQKQVLLS